MRFYTFIHSKKEEDHSILKNKIHFHFLHISHFPLTAYIYKFHNLYNHFFAQEILHANFRRYYHLIAEVTAFPFGGGIGELVALREIRAG